MGQDRVVVSKLFTEAGDQSAGQANSGGKGDLLAQDGAHRQLNPVPRAGHAQAEARIHERRQRRIFVSCSAMASGSAARSKTRRRRAIMLGRAESLEKRTAARRAFPSGLRQKW
jgi:hypothetical protein